MFAMLETREEREKAGKEKLRQREAHHWEWKKWRTRKQGVGCSKQILTYVDWVKTLPSSYPSFDRDLPAQGRIREKTLIPKMADMGERLEEEARIAGTPKTFTDMKQVAESMEKIQVQ
jgi:hypothetical protein